MSLYKKMIDEGVGAAKAVMGVIQEHRGADFSMSQCQPYVDAVNTMEPGDGQSKEVIDLHVQSVNTHYDVLKGLTDFIRSEDDSFVEHYQTPPILEILYEEDPEFKASMWKFIDAVGKNKALIGRDAVRRYGGMYGLSCVVDFAMPAGSVPATVNRILTQMDIPVAHKQAILAAKSWGMNTSYGFGAAFRAALEAGKTAAEAEQAEVDMIQYIYREPVAAQNEIMATHNLGGHGPHTSFDTNKYMMQYKDRMKPYILAAKEAGVHLGNVMTVPAYCVGDIGHHMSQSMYNMTKNNMVMGIIEAVVGSMESTLYRGLEQDAYKNEWDVLKVATGSAATAAAYVLWLDSFTVPMIIDLFSKRFYNYAAMNPARGEADELHNTDFIDVLLRGEQTLDPKPIGKGGKVKGVKVDLDPVNNHPVVMNPQQHTYPVCAITQRFAGLMTLSDFPCLLTNETCTATLVTNAIALSPGVSASPVRASKRDAVTTLIKRNVPFVKGLDGGAQGYDQWDVAV